MSSDENGLCIMLLTYDRLEYARLTLVSILSELRYTRGPIHLHIASDGDTGKYIESLRAGRDATVSNSKRKGYGASYNLATQTVHQIPGVKYVLPLEDDWECIGTVDADHFTRVLDDGSIGCLRLGYLGYTQQLDGTVVYVDDSHHLLLRSDSAEPHVFAGHPRIETVEWERYVGPWPEEKGAGATEFAVAHLPQARRQIAWPMEIDPRAGYGLFAHIGTERADDAFKPVESAVVA